jgi:hypothetical protein
VKLTIALQLEQHVKKDLAKKLGQLLENLYKIKAVVELRAKRLQVFHSSKTSACPISSRTWWPINSTWLSTSS